MSETEHNVGRLTPVAYQKENQTDEDFVKEYLNSQGYMKLGKWSDSWLEYFRDEFYKVNFFHKGVIYNIEYRDAEYDDIFEATMHPDGTINFVTKYYNGGCGFDEALNYAMGKLNETN